MISPIDGRYRNSKLWMLEERAIIDFMVQYEVEYLNLLRNKLGRSSKENCVTLTNKDVNNIELGNEHFTKSVIECIKKKVSVEDSYLVHLGLTSSDTQDSAYSIMMKEFNITLCRLLDGLKKTIEKLKSPITMMGRTHGQHAVPIVISEYVSNFLYRILMIKKDMETYKFYGKASGAVGNYSALGLIIKDPVDFELEFLDKLGLGAAYSFSQTLRPEFFINYLHLVCLLCGVVADFANDIRQLARNEIDEIREVKPEGYVGSSTMPHKSNPWKFEHVVGMWRNVVTRMQTFYQLQASEHQRDLTDSVTKRFIPEFLAMVYNTVDSFSNAIENVRWNFGSIAHNKKDYINTEEMYVVLNLRGMDGHKIVRGALRYAENSFVPLNYAMFRTNEKAYDVLVGECLMEEI